MKEKVLFSWSGGKESALALHKCFNSGKYEIVALLTISTKNNRRTTMHGIRENLLDLQVKALGIALEKVLISEKCNNDEYESKMFKVLKKYQSQGVKGVIFGDIFLDDLKKYREEKMSRLAMKAIFPLWKKRTAELAGEFINSGFKAIITSVDTDLIDKKFIGRYFDKQLLNELPSTADPCGENGEFHCFVYDGPVFQNSILYKKGKTFIKDKRFYYCDLVPFQND
ncbi:MAG: Dph6-related ATP pyrophosphatase [Planctomycetota bacterium]|jgi:uncharacterized protein (TIGR00290 family)